MSDNENEERVTADSYGTLETSEAASECWLIRVPQKLYETLLNAPEGTDLGELVFKKGGPAQKSGLKPVKPSLTVHMHEHIAAFQPKPRSSANPSAPAASGALPLNYSLQAMTKKIPVMHPFCRNQNNGSVQLLGTVSRTANLQVEQDSNVSSYIVALIVVQPPKIYTHSHTFRTKQYRAMLKDRMVASNITSSRFVKPVEATESIVSKQRQPPPAPDRNTFGNAVLQFGKRAMEMQQDASLQARQGPSKKSRRFAPDQPIKSILFELFGQQQYWTVKDLKAAAVAGGATDANTKRAETEIRDVLRDIGDYHRSGDHKNMWELRKEFQQAE
jgi:hypothetical protein